MSSGSFLTLLSQYPLILRVEAAVALRKILQGAGRGSTDLTNKDILKTLKITLTDKALIMRSSSAEVMTDSFSSFRLTPWHPNCHC